MMNDFKKPKPILSKGVHKKKTKMTWDEGNLQMNEDEKVPRMPINEPKTPFCSSSNPSLEDDSLSSVSLNDEIPITSISDHYSADEMSDHSVGRDSISEDEKEKFVFSEDSMNSLAQKALEKREDNTPKNNDEFLKHRKLHYNEFLVMKNRKKDIEDEE